ncbi:MAG: 16S rRNA (adenine(1518)-N(6)/adenine(1519)-N(6))-dimethyltransferase RsmA [Alphaproteobacteria bacterium]|nr:16S rRNA (adenine(1518)-N(6)/adenine(1519)-N(6))-dimethyltransferase RsmA [Alphaproteobacteria bacterium]
MNEPISLRETVEKYELLAKKSLGQNFLLDMNITDKIIRSSLEAQGLSNFHGQYVYEIGPGPGGLTRAVLKAEPQRLTVIEMDGRCIKIMNELKEFYGDKLEIIQGDALKYIFPKESRLPQNIVSNLPYNISVPLLTGWLKNIYQFKSLTLMFQKEVAERIIAEPNNKNYGRLSVLAQLTCKIKLLLNLNPNCFVPAPKIWSSVLLFLPLEQIPDTEMLAKVERLTEAAFGQRRKMIRQSLKNIPNFEEICARLNIDTTLRAENLSPQQFLEMAKLM